MTDFSGLLAAVLPTERQRSIIVALHTDPDELPADVTYEELTWGLAEYSKWRPSKHFNRSRNEPG